MTFLRAATLVCVVTLVAAVLAHETRAADVGFGFGTRAPAAPASFADLAEKLLPTVVNISSSQKAAEDKRGAHDDDGQNTDGSPFDNFMQDFGQAQPGTDGFALPQASLGSGFVIDAARGLVVTNNHVIKDADEIRVTFHNDKTLDAKVLGVDAKTDLAVLQVDPKKMKLTAAQFGNSDAMRVGDWIVAIGNPFGLGGTVTAGIISARARDINSGPYDDYLQTDASINRGNSGGPMFNTKGDVIGINTAIFSPSGGSVGIGFAIPSNLVKPVVDQIVKYGRTKRGWIGVRIQPVTDDIAESLGLGDNRGALIASVSPKGPADVSGLKPGDIVTMYNGQPVGGTRGLPRLVADTEIGTDVLLHVLRDGKEMTIRVRVDELEKAEDAGLVTGEKPSKNDTSDEGTVIPGTGLTLSTITAQDRDDLELPDGTNGVIVLNVKPGSEGALKGIELGDIIVEINQQKVEDPDTAAGIIKSALADGKSSVLLLVDSQGKGDVRFVALKLKK